MLCSNCGGKLSVIDSFQIPQDDGIKIERIRKCPNCKERIISFEIIKGACIEKGYIHNVSMKKFKTAD